MLIKNGADPNLKNDDGQSPLEWVIEKKFDNILPYLQKTKTNNEEPLSKSEDPTEEI